MKLTMKNSNGFSTLGILAIIAAVLVLAGGGYLFYRYWQYYAVQRSFNPASKISHFRVGSWPKFVGTVIQNDKRSFFCFDCLPTMWVRIVGDGDVFVEDCYGNEDFKFKKGDIVEVWGIFDSA